MLCYYAIIIVFIKHLNLNVKVNLPNQQWFCPSQPFSFEISWLNSVIYFTFDQELRKNLHKYGRSKVILLKSTYEKVLTDNCKRICRFFGESDEKISMHRLWMDL